MEKKNIFDIFKFKPKKAISDFTISRPASNIYNSSTDLTNVGHPSKINQQVKETSHPDLGNWDSGPIQPVLKVNYQSN